MRRARILVQGKAAGVLEKLDLFRRTLFSFLTGNENMHLKNFSLTIEETRVRLSPAYDLLNTTIALPGASEELALPLRGKRRKLKRDDLIDYYGRKHLGLQPAAIDDVLATLARVVSEWEELVKASFLPPDLQEKYLWVVRDRVERLAL